MTIEQFNDPEKGYFHAVDESREAGRMTYTRAGGKLIINHTEVHPDYGGQGLGMQMLMEAVHFARKEKATILPLCPFAKAMFRKTESIRDVLA